MTLLFLESVGTSELLLILVVALIIFGPRKLPELSRSLGKGLSEFKRASDEFKRTWEREVNLESYERERQTTDAMLPPEQTSAIAATNTIGPPAATEDALGANTIARGAGANVAEAGAVASSGLTAEATAAESGAATVESGASRVGSSRDASDVAPQSPHKADWL